MEWNSPYDHWKDLSDSDEKHCNASLFRSDTETIKYGVYALAGEEEAEAQKQGKCAHDQQAGEKRDRVKETFYEFQVKADSFFNFFEPPTIPDDPKAEVDEDTQVI